MASLETKLKERSMWVVKVGGSLLGSPELQQWVDVLAKCTDQRLIIVPGGGIFADAARQAQTHSKVSDACAHELAALAMDQFGLMLANMNRSLATASSECEIDERTWQHRSIIWLPSKMVMADDEIEKSWDVTSDSLAAWLALKMQAQHLIIIKSDKPDAKQVALEDIQKTGLIDPAFRHYGLKPAFTSWLVKKTDFVHFEAGIDIDKLRMVASQIQ